MFSPILIIFYIGIIVWVILYLVKLHRSSLAESDVNQEEKLFVFFPDDEASDPKERETIGPENNMKGSFPPDDEKRPAPVKTPAFQSNTDAWNVIGYSNGAPMFYQ